MKLVILDDDKQYTISFKPDAKITPEFLEKSLLKIYKTSNQKFDIKFKLSIDFYDVEKDEILTKDEDLNLKYENKIKSNTSIVLKIFKIYRTEEENISNVNNQNVREIIKTVTNSNKLLRVPLKRNSNFEKKTYLSIMNNLHNEWESLLLYENNSTISADTTLVNVLVDMGFEQERVKSALMMTKNNMDEAAELLLCQEFENNFQFRRRVIYII
jgi:hypothetical protein